MKEACDETQERRIREKKKKKKKREEMSLVATPIDAETVLATLRLAWSSRSSSQWLPDNPARGQCNVTAILLHDLYGAEILKTPLATGEHFYNRIGHERIDLTATQFDAPITYADIASSVGGVAVGTQARITGLWKGRLARYRLAGNKSFGIIAISRTLDIFGHWPIDTRLSNAAG